jgi:site-specific DNA-cytosine methylase
MTLSAAAVKGPPRAWLEHGRVVQMTPRALARFQSAPDTYQLPQSNKLACRVIGNGVPSLLAQRVAESFG